MKYRLIWSLVAAIFLQISAGATYAAAEKMHGIAMHGDPALPAGFSHLPYANPDAPKGGRLRQAIIGSFDSLNPLIIRGQSAAGIREYVYESLMLRNRAEPFSLYGHIAEALEVNADRSQVTFHLNPKAKFSDGAPVTVKDVLFSLEILREKGRPNHRTFYKKVLQTTVLNDHSVRLDLEPGDKELVLILGLMPVLPAHYFETREFEQTTFDKPIGSGPYVVEDVKPGAKIIYKRDPNYWARDLPGSKGRWNFDTVEFEYFRDVQTAFEAFKKGLIDIRYEGDARRWATGYDFNTSQTGSELIMETIEIGLPKPLSAFVFNARRPLMADRRVRSALIHAFDFEWAQKNLFNGLMKRTQGYFDGSELSSIGHPASPAERELLKSAGVDLPRDILEGQRLLPVSDGTGQNRQNLRKAVTLLRKAGWKLQSGGLVNEKGETFALEMMVTGRDQERIGLHYQRSLKLIGIDLSLRQVDSAQFQRRLQSYEYDIVPFTWYNSLSPGNEQSFYWGSAGRDQEGTRNYMGVADPAIDRLIQAVLEATDRPQFVDAVRALDRTLIAGNYLLPLYHAPGQWLARWSHIARPPEGSLYGFQPDAAWHLNP